jgi:hypothetical protein
MRSAPATWRRSALQFGRGAAVLAQELQDPGDAHQRVQDLVGEPLQEGRERVERLVAGERRALRREQAGDQLLAFREVERVEQQAVRLRLDGGAQEPRPPDRHDHHELRLAAIVRSVATSGRSAAGSVTTSTKSRSTRSVRSFCAAAARVDSGRPRAPVRRAPRASLRAGGRAR